MLDFRSEANLLDGFGQRFALPRPEVEVQSRMHPAVTVSDICRPRSCIFDVQGTQGRLQLATAFVFGSARLLRTDRFVSKLLDSLRRAHARSLPARCVTRCASNVRWARASARGSWLGLAAMLGRPRRKLRVCVHFTSAGAYIPPNLVIVWCHLKHLEVLPNAARGTTAAPVIRAWCSYG